MSVLTAAAHRFDRLLNPIVVKELRQAVRSRFVSGMLILFLIVQLSAVTIAVLGRADLAEDFSLSAGQEITAVLFGILIVACLLFVPMYTGIRLTHERRDIQGDLMYTTTISPWAIVRGKLISAVMLTVLIYSVCMPFMTFTYLLRGVDVQVLLVCLGVGFVGVLVGVQLAILWSCIRASGVLRILMNLAGMGALVTMAYGLIGFLVNAMDYGLPTDEPWFWPGMATAGAFALLAVGLVHCLSVALISPDSSNRMLATRIYLTATWFITLGIAGYWWDEIGDWEFIYVWAVGSVVILIGGLMVAVSERQEWGPRVRRSIPRNPLGRLIAFLFYSGAAGGILWCVILMGLTLLIAYLAGPVSARRYGWDRDEVIYLLGLAQYAVAYALTGLLLWRVLMARRMKHIFIWVVVLLLVAVGMVGPILGTFLLRSGWDGDMSVGNNFLMVTNPVTMGEDEESRAVCLVFSGLWALVAAVLSLPWMIEQFGKFKSLKPARAKRRGPASDG
ncbi:hypothetical protein LCGC14_0204880 [marine sediment metagenome]|uniref:Uncharacterized protein n=1 Tax=marine sediment metagenome TaxID=412755 RepID=A0A0F9UHN3_9ZZZZ|nr:hypothetical protein [Phycisphaerae bacterium]HDZ42929.1 hypothetical protein [Phycisphaerae bacterium]